MASHGDDTPDTLGNTRLFSDDKVFDISSLGNVSEQVLITTQKPMKSKSNSRSTTQFNTRLPPFSIFDVIGNLDHIELQGDDSYWVRI